MLLLRKRVERQYAEKWYSVPTQTQLGPQGAICLQRGYPTRDLCRLLPCLQQPQARQRLPVRRRGEGMACSQENREGLSVASAENTSPSNVLTRNIARPPVAGKPLLRDARRPHEPIPA